MTAHGVQKDNCFAKTKQLSSSVQHLTKAKTETPLFQKYKEAAMKLKGSKAYYLGMML